jgi:hypothetical protein
MLPARRSTLRFTSTLAAGGAGVLALLLATSGSPAYAAEAPVPLGTAGSFAVLAGSTVTNTGPSVLNGGSLGLAPGTSVTGFPPGTITPPHTRYVANGVADSAKGDLVTAYNNAAGRSMTGQVSAPLGGGQTLTAGVYKADSSMALNGSLTLSGNADDVFIFQAGTTLITGSNASVNLTGEVSACNVFWQVGTSATLGTDTTFAGTIMAMASVSLNTRATVTGRVLARNGAVTLQNNVINAPDCGQADLPAPTDEPTDTPTDEPSDTPGDTPSDTPTTVGGTGGAGGTTGTNGTGGTGTNGTGGIGTSGFGATSTIPAGHPETGRAPAPVGDTDVRLLVVGGLVLAGAALAARRSRRAVVTD